MKTKIIFFLSLLFIFTTTSAEMKACTMDYNPVCGVDGNTYGNSCTAGDIKIAYQGECTASGRLSQNDSSHYNHLHNTLPKDVLNGVDNSMQIFKNKVANFSTYKQALLRDALVAKLEERIAKHLMNYPQDKALPEDANNTYNKLQLLLLELKNIDIK